MALSTSTQELEGLVARLRDVVTVRRPASDTKVHEAERLFGRALPQDLLRFYRRLDGTEDETPPTNGWVQFLPMHQWETVQSVLSPISVEAEQKYRPFLTAIVFAEHCQSSWWYAASPATGGTRETLIYYIDGWREPFVVASRFNDFLAAVLADGRELYPRD